jgi:hypothetical protein
MFPSQVVHIGTAVILFGRRQAVCGESMPRGGQSSPYRSDARTCPQCQLLRPFVGPDGWLTTPGELLLSRLDQVARGAMQPEQVQS